MPTVSCSTELSTNPWAPDAIRRAAADVGILLRFRSGTVRRRGARTWITAVFVGLTLAAAVVPALVPGAVAGPGAAHRHAFDLLLLLPTAMAGFLLLAVVSAVASGGGRELFARDQAVAYPVSPTTDHLGALLLSPLNIAWLIQAWTLLGTTSFVLGPSLDLVPGELAMLLWLVAATTIAQVVAWSMEAVRRRPRGVIATRTLVGAVALVAAWLQLSGHLTSALDRVPTVWLVTGLIDGFGWTWAGRIAVLVTLVLGTVVLGAIPAHAGARLASRDESKLETRHYPPARLPRSVFGMLVRIDRGSVWRAVPMRRGLAVLSIGPGVIAFAGNLPWTTMTVLPGLVASGGALLFGVNAWCLDGRGTLMRESLPVSPDAVFGARAYVLAECLAGVSLLTMLLAGLRAGLPSAAELTALLCTMVVVTLQVVGASLRWSDRRPFPVDLRSARATPAPPIVMVGYSARLATSTTLTGLVFSGLAHLPAWQLPVLVALPFIGWSGIRLLHTRDRWVEPANRARIVTSVSA
ncbi:MAG: hypothetical protein ACR2K3_14120 [Nocardioides sp.]